MWLYLLCAIVGALLACLDCAVYHRYKVKQLMLNFEKKLNDTEEQSYNSGYDQAIKDTNSTKNYDAHIVYEVATVKPELVKIVLRFPSYLFNNENAFSMVEDEIAAELGKYLVENKKIHIEQFDNFNTFEKGFIATCYVSKGF